MVVIAGIPLVYWGIGLLLAGGTAVAFQEYNDEDLDLGRIDLDDLLGGRDPEPEQEFDPLRYIVVAEAMRQLVQTQTRARERLDEDDCDDCQRCKPYDEGNDVIRSFSAGTVRRPSPGGLGAYYQHFIVPWFALTATRGANDSLFIDLGEWEWRRGVEGSWDGLRFTDCALMEVKLGYRDFLDESQMYESAVYDRPNPLKPFLGSLGNKFLGQLNAQIALVRAAGLPANLEWLFSDDQVLWQFAYMCRDYAHFDVNYEHRPFAMAPSGTQFVRELYSGDDQLYGYWEDPT